MTTQSSPGAKSGATRHDRLVDVSQHNPPTRTTAPTLSQQVSWWSVHERVTRLLAAVGDWPTVGTPAWCALADSDPAKTAALFDAAQHWALRLETCQAAKCEASQAISSSAEWAAIAAQIHGHEQFYAERPWLKRKTS